MRKAIFLLSACFSLAALGQPVPATTPFTRAWLRSTGYSNAWYNLGIASTNQTTFTNVAVVNVTNSYSVTNIYSNTNAYSVDNTSITTNASGVLMVTNGLTALATNNAAALTNIQQVFPDTPIPTVRVTSVATLISLANTSSAGSTVYIPPGTYDIGTNQLIIPDGVNLIGAGSPLVNIIGYADCAGVEQGFAPTGGPQIHPGNNCLVQGFTVTCDTNSMIAMLSPVQAHSGTWSGIGVSYLNPPANLPTTNALIRDVRVFEGYFDCFHFNSSNRCDVRLEWCQAEAQGGTFNFVSATTPTSHTNSSFVMEHCTAITHGIFPDAIVGVFASQDATFLAYDCPVTIRDCWASIKSAATPVTGALGTGNPCAVADIDRTTIYAYGLTADTSWNNPTNVFGTFTWINSAGVTNVVKPHPPTTRYVGDGSGLTNLTVTGTSGISTNSGSGTNNTFTTPTIDGRLSMRGNAGGNYIELDPISSAVTITNLVAWSSSGLKLFADSTGIGISDGASLTYLGLDPMVGFTFDADISAIGHLVNADMIVATNFTGNGSGLTNIPSTAITGLVAGSATNAVDTVKTNGTATGGIVTNVDFYAGTGISLAASNVDSQARVVITATGTGTGNALTNPADVQVFTGTNHFNVDSTEAFKIYATASNVTPEITFASTNAGVTASISGGSNTLTLSPGQNGTLTLLGNIIAATWNGTNFFNGGMRIGGVLRLDTGTVRDLRDGNRIIFDDAGTHFYDTNTDLVGEITTNGFAGGGSLLTALNGTQVTSGTVADARLSGNVALRNAANDFSADTNYFRSIVASDITTTNGSTMTVGNLAVTGSLTGNGASLTNIPAAAIVGGVGSQQTNISWTAVTNLGQAQLPASVITNTLSDAQLSANVPVMTAGVLPAVDGHLLTGISGAGINQNAGYGTNVSLIGEHFADKPATLFAKPTWWLAYGDSLTQYGGNPGTAHNYVDQLTNLFRLHNFFVANYGQSSYHIGDVSNSFYGGYNSGTRCYTNHLPSATTNAMFSAMVGINDLLYDTIDVGQWIQTWTNMFWTAHTNGFNPCVAFTIQDSQLLDAAKETTRAALNYAIKTNYALCREWMMLVDSDLALPSTNSIFYLYNGTDNYGLHPNDYGHSCIAQAFGSQLHSRSNLFRGIYSDGYVWSENGFVGNGSLITSLNPSNFGNGTISVSKVPVNTIVAAGTGTTVASNSVNGVQTYTVTVPAQAATSSLVSKRCWAYYVYPSSTPYWGWNYSTTGTGGGIKSATDINAGELPYSVLYANAGATNNYEMLYDGNLTIPAGKALNITYRIALTNTATTRVVLGCYAQYFATATATGDGYQPAAGLVYDSTNSPNWVLWVNDGSGTPTSQNTGVAADTSFHTFTISVGASSTTTASIDGASVATNSYALRSGGIYGNIMSICTQSTNATAMKVIQMYGEQDF